MSEQLYTVEEVCNIFKISRKTLYNWKDRGILAPIKIGKSIRYSKEDINKLILKSRQDINE